MGALNQLLFIKIPWVRRAPRSCIVTPVNSCRWLNEAMQPYLSDTRFGLKIFLKVVLGIKAAFCYILLRGRHSSRAENNVCVGDLNGAVCKATLCLQNARVWTFNFKTSRGKFSFFRNTYFEFKFLTIRQFKDLSHLRGRLVPVSWLMDERNINRQEFEYW